jgi:hypothetical protein
MKTAIVIAELPNTNTPDADRVKWQDFLARVQRVGKTPKDTIRQTGNVWQIPLDNGLPFLGRLFDSAEASKISMRALILDEPPAWIENPPTNQGKI